MPNQVEEGTLNIYTIRTKDDQGAVLVSCSAEALVCDPSNTNKIAQRGERVTASFAYDGAKTQDQVKADAIAALLAKVDA